MWALMVAFKGKNEDLMIFPNENVSRKLGTIDLGEYMKADDTTFLGRSGI